MEDGGPARIAGDTDVNAVLDSQQPELASFRDPSLDPFVAGTDYVTAVTSSGTLNVGTPPVPISGPLDATPVTSLLNIRIVGLPLVAGSPAVATLDLYVPAEANSFFAYDAISATWTDITAVARSMERSTVRDQARASTPAFRRGGGRGSRSKTVDSATSTVGSTGSSPWSVRHRCDSPRTRFDADGDGIDDVIENAGPNDGDSTINNVPDAEESYVGSLPDPTLADPDGDGSNYVTVDAYYLLDPSTYPDGSAARISPVVDVSITAPPSNLPAAGAGLITGLIEYTQSGLPLNGQPGVGAQPGDPVSTSPATAGTYVWLPYEPNSFWIFDPLTATWTDGTSLINETGSYLSTRTSLVNSPAGPSNCSSSMAVSATLTAWSTAK